MKPTFAEAIRAYAESLPPGSRLLTEPELAQYTGCSVRTVNTHLSALAAEGLVVRRRGSGTFIPPDSTVPAPSAPARDTATAVADAVQDEIRHGRYKRGEILPSVKRLAVETGTGPATVVKAYALLRQRALIIKTGKSFRVGTLTDTMHPARRKRVYLISNGRYDFEALYRYDAFRFTYRSMDRELQRNGWLSLHAEPSTVPELLKQWQKSNSAPDGLVLCGFREDDFARFRPQLHGLTRKLEHRMPPLLIDWRQGRLRERPADSRIITWGNVMRASGKALTDYLLEKAFSSAVLFMHEDGFVWNFMANSLFLFTITGHMRARNASFDLQYLFKPARTGRKHLAWLTTERLPEAIGDHCRISKDEALNMCKANMTITADFSQQYRQHLSTPVWIFDRAEQAAHALGWLQRQNIRVPDDVAVISLEDNPAYLHLGMTVCSPDWETIGYQMAHALIRDYTVATTDRGFLKAPGTVVEKLTTP